MPSFGMRHSDWVLTHVGILSPVNLPPLIPTTDKRSNQLRKIHATSLEANP